MMSAPSPRRSARRLALAALLLAGVAPAGWGVNGQGLAAPPHTGAQVVMDAEDLDLSVPCLGRFEIMVDPAMSDGVSIDSSPSGGAHLTMRTGKTQGSSKVLITSRTCAPNARVSILVAPNVGVLIHDSHDTHIVIHGTLASLEASLEAGQLDADTIQSLDLSLRGTEQVHIASLNRAAQVVETGASGLVVDHADLDAFSAQLSESSHLSVTDGRFDVLTLMVENAATARLGGSANTATVSASGTGLVAIPSVSGALTRTGNIQIGPVAPPAPVAPPVALPVAPSPAPGAPPAAAMQDGSSRNADPRAAAPQGTDQSGAKPMATTPGPVSGAAAPDSPTRSGLTQTVPSQATTPQATVPPAPPAAATNPAIPPAVPQTPITGATSSPDGAGAEPSATTSTRASATQAPATQAPSSLAPSSQTPPGPTTATQPPETGTPARTAAGIAVPGNATTSAGATGAQTPATMPGNAPGGMPGGVSAGTAPDLPVRTGTSLPPGTDNVGESAARTTPLPGNNTGDGSSGADAPAVQSPAPQSRNVQAAGRAGQTRQPATSAARGTATGDAPQ